MLSSGRKDVNEHQRLAKRLLRLRRLRPPPPDLLIEHWARRGRELQRRKRAMRLLDPSLTTAEPENSGVRDSEGDHHSR